jgi:transmembrane sensor
MRTPEEDERLWAEWSRAAHEATPAVDVMQGRKRLLDEQRSLARRGHARLRRRVWVAAGALAAMVAVVRLAWLRPLTFEHAGLRDEPGAWLATDRTGDLPLRFSEGTVVVLAPDSRGRVDELRTRGARLVLERGKLRANVTHRLRSDWRFAAGPFEVAVTGTALEIGWDPVRERFSTTVTSGAVRVMGPSVGAEVTVREGERCDVDLRQHTMQLRRLEAAAPEAERPVAPSVAPALAAPVAAPEPQAPPMAPAIRQTPSRHAGGHGAAAPRPSWTRLEERGRYEEALAAIGRAGVDTVFAAATDDELLRVARLARAAGDAALEHRALVTCRARFAHTASAGVAAFELGRAAAAGDAARWFDVYLDEQAEGPLAEEASGRLVEALEVSGRHDDAVRAAERSLTRFPNGPYASMARRVIGSRVR